MLTLHLFRHAKSDWAQPELDDYDRPLAPRGRSAAPAMGALMARTGVAPDLVLCSTAARAQQTALLAFDVAGWPETIVYRRDLYLAEADAILRIVQAAGGSSAAIMAIGHNPGLGELASALAGAGDAAAQERLAAEFPTGALATIVFGAASWTEIAPGAGRLDAFSTPRDEAEYERSRG